MTIFDLGGGSGLGRYELGFLKEESVRSIGVSELLTCLGSGSSDDSDAEAVSLCMSHKS